MLPSPSTKYTLTTGIALVGARLYYGALTNDMVSET